MIIDKIKDYFSKKDNEENTNVSPDGTCPICWGREEWDGQYYKLKKDKSLTKGGDNYNSFINKIVERHVDTVHKIENKYVCTTCDKEI